MDSWKVGFVKGILQVILVMDISFRVLVKTHCVAQTLLAF